MTTIWKYPLFIKDSQQIDVPLVHRWLHVDTQGDELCLWALVDDESDQQEVTILICGTGNPAPEPRDARYLGSAVMPPFVWHVFEELTEEQVLGQMLTAVAGVEA